MPKSKKKRIKEEVPMDFQEDKARISINYNIDMPVDDIKKDEKLKPEQFSMKELRAEKLRESPKVEKLSEPVAEKKPVEGKKKEGILDNEKKVSTIFLWISILIIIGLIVLIINLDKIVPVQESSQGDIVALVNGEEITKDAVERTYKVSVPVQFRNSVTEDVFLEKSFIPQIVLMQEARKYDFYVSDEEVKGVVRDLIEQNGVDEETFNEQLKGEGLSLDDVYDIYRTNLIINKLLNATLLSGVEIELEEQVRASHILVETEDEANEILKELEDGKDFGSLASEKSIDPSAQTNKGDLGYFSKGAMVQAFEDVAFSLDVGKISDPVRTGFGYHIIKVEDKKPARTVLYGDIIDIQERQAAYEKNKQLVQTYVDVLVAGADIEIIGEDGVEDVEEEVEEEIIVEEEEEVVEEVMEEEIVEEEEVMEEVEEDVEEEVIVEGNDLDSLTSCLAERDVAVYVSSFECSYCVEQKSLLGAGITKIKTVDCWDGTTPEQTAECENLGIEGYPTWIVNGKQLRGVQSADDLRGESGC